MVSLQDLVGREQGDAALGEISRSVGADETAVASAVQTALPMLVSGLANNASTPQGAESLNRALETDHNGSVLNNLGGLWSMIFDQQGAAPRQADAGGILGNIFGGSQGQVVEQVSRQSGLGTGQTAQILMFLAPIIMGYVGRQKREQGVGAGGLGGLLGGLLGGGPVQAPPQQTGGILDRNGDGSAVDDIASMAFDYIRRRG